MGAAGLDEARVDAAGRDQARVVADGVDPSRVEDDDVVGVADGGEPVGDHQDGAVADGVQQFPDDVRLAAFVDRAGRLVEDEHGGVREEGPREGEPLSLPAGQGGAALAEDGGVAVGEGGDLVVDARHARRRRQVLVRGVRPGHAQVVGDRGVEEVRVLRHHGDALP